jgi:hypothetical protein
MNCNYDLAVASGSQLSLFLVASGSELSFLVVSVVLSILQVGAIEIFKLQVGCKYNLLGARKP